MQKDEEGFWWQQGALKGEKQEVFLSYLLTDDQ